MAVQVLIFEFIKSVNLPKAVPVVGTVNGNELLLFPKSKSLQLSRLSGSLGFVCWRFWQNQNSPSKTGLHQRVEFAPTNYSLRKRGLCSVPLGEHSNSVHADVPVAAGRLRLSSYVRACWKMISCPWCPGERGCEERLHRRIWNALNQSMWILTYLANLALQKYLWKQTLSSICAACGKHVGLHAPGTRLCCF